MSIIPESDRSMAPNYLVLSQDRVELVRNSLCVPAHILVSGINAVYLNIYKTTGKLLNSIPRSAYGGSNYDPKLTQPVNLNLPSDFQPAIVIVNSEIFPATPQIDQMHVAITSQPADEQQVCRKMVVPGKKADNLHSLLVRAIDGAAIPQDILDSVTLTGRPVLIVSVDSKMSWKMQKEGISGAGSYTLMILSKHDGASVCIEPLTYTEEWADYYRKIRENLENVSQVFVLQFLH